MKTGIELIAQERQEQIEKHGWDIDHDLFEYEQSNGTPLIDAAVGILNDDRGNFPAGWDETTVGKILNKSYVARLSIAGALIAAEIDRLQREENKTKQ